MPEQLVSTISWVQGLAPLQILIVVLLWGLAERIGIPITAFSKRLLKMNGSNGNGYEKLQKEIQLLRENHTHDLGTKMDALMEEERRGNEVSRETLTILKLIHDDLRK